MPTPTQAAKSLKRTAKKLSTLHEPIVAEAAGFAVERALGAGGTFLKGRYVLIAELDRKGTRSKKGRSEAVVLGSPPGFWSMKSYGRRGGYEAGPSRSKRINLRAAPVSRPGTSPATAFKYVTPGPTQGDNRWNVKVVDATEEEYLELAGRILDQELDL